MPKRISKPRQVVSINLDREIVDKLDRDRRDLTRSDTINALIKAGYQYYSRGQKKLFETDWKDDFNTYTLKGSAQRLIDALNDGKIQHHNGKMFLWVLGVLWDLACEVEPTSSINKKRDNFDIGAAHSKPIPYGEIE